MKPAKPLNALEAINKEWPIAVEIRKLQSRLWRLTQKQDKRVVLFTSAVGGEGKTTTTAYTAATLASHGGRRILILDCDLRRPTMHEHFELDPGPGMSELLIGKSDLDGVTRSTPLEGLKVITAGEAPENPGMLLDSPRLTGIMAQLRRDYDLILIDSPPIVPVADTSALVPLTDGIILVVMAGKTPRPLLAKARELVLGMGGSILGLVVGNAQEASPESYRDSYYYSYTRQKTSS